MTHFALVSLGRQTHGPEPAMVPVAWHLDAGAAALPVADLLRSRARYTVERCGGWLRVVEVYRSTEDARVQAERLAGILELEGVAVVRAPEVWEGSVVLVALPQPGETLELWELDYAAEGRRLAWLAPPYAREPDARVEAAVPRSRDVTRWLGGRLPEPGDGMLW